jgi:pimeloyl-ACP methyl ester carboxylesterase
VRKEALTFLLLCAGLLINGCTTERRPRCASLSGDPGELTAVCRVHGLSDEVKSRLLALNPERVTPEEVRDLLSQNPAPRIVNIHGGILPIKTGMNSFARFLFGMGYPEASILNPGNGSYTYGYYDDADKIAGAIAWYYERDGLRPMLVGHSQGGIQAIRVLHKLAGNYGKRVAVWNPVTRKEEKRYEIIDPLTGGNRPVVGLRVSYATAAVAGGLARVLPNEWDMNSKLRKIPDSVEEFTGFQKGLDILGGDFLGYGYANEYHATGSAKVRNVRLPAASAHSTIPYTKGLLSSQAIKDWISSYQQDGQGEKESGSDPQLGRKNAQMLWAAEVWHGVKKHWVLELQRLIRAQGANYHDG